MATLSLKDVNKIYDNKVNAVYYFTMDIKDGEFIVFLVHLDVVKQQL